MELFLAAVAVLLGTGGLALGLEWLGRTRAANGAGSAGAAAGSLLGLAAAVRSLAAGGPEPRLELPWAVPYGSFSLGLDGLTCAFLLPAFLLGAAAAVYGGGSLAPRATGAGRKALGVHWFFFCLAVASLALVLAARNAVLFLVCWEIMSVAPYFLITLDDERGEVRSAGWVYLVAAHLGAAFLFALFVILGRQSGSMEFAAFLPAGLPADGTASLLLLLALVGFGAKAGLMPLHVWMPEAYPVAPCHISAFMSGAMSKAGIYGLLRVLTFLGQPQEWWPVLLVVVGLVTAIMGILMALSKANLKRMLAYSSVENIGIITTGIGLGLLGQQAGHSALAALGFGGAILHVLNHALMKGLLFLAAGTVLGATGTVVMDRLGGLMKRLPLTGLAFVLGAAAMCGLPPLNGFASELLMYMCAGLIGIKAQTAMAIPAWGAVAGLAFAGGMAAYAFAKAVGTVFLGEPRTADGHGASEPSLPQRATVALLAAGCVMAGLGAPWLLGAVAPAVSVVLGPAVQVGQAAQAAEIGRQALAPAAELLGNVVRVAAPLVGLALVLAWLRLRLLAGRPVGTAGTWDCGYLAPSNRMQYTGSSFSQPMIELMHPALHVERGVDPVRGLFPGRASFRLAAPDWMREYLYDPLMDGLDWGSDHLKWLQHGNVNLYILYIVITLVALLAWRLW